MKMKNKIENLLLCVGAQKAGTTWLYKQLDNHPDIQFSFNKEVQYFSTIHNRSNLIAQRKVFHLKKMLENNPERLIQYFIAESVDGPGAGDRGVRGLLSGVDDEWYLRQFRPQKKRFCADFSPEYAKIGVPGYDHVKRLSENQKIIFVMREPAARLKSALSYHIQMLNIDETNLTNEEWKKLVRLSFLQELGDYQSTIADLRASFNEEDIIFMFFEKIMQNKKEALQELNTALGVTDFVEDDMNLEEKVNISKKVEIPSIVLDDIRAMTANTKAFVLNEFPEVRSIWEIN